MTKAIGRPVEFGDGKRETFCALVGVGLSRRQAAEYLGIAPSTPLRAAERDDAFAELLRTAEMRCEMELMERMRRQCERSWRACVWMLEQIHPERYGKGKNNASTGPSVEQLFESFVALVEHKVADENLREQLFGELDQLMLEDFASDDSSPPPAPAGDRPLRPIQPANGKPATSNGSLSSHPAALNGNGNNPKAPAAGDPARGKNGQGIRRPTPAAAPVAPRKAALPAQAASPLMDDLLGDLGRRKSVASPALDFCNTSPDTHERRSLAALCR
jgi:hypothetical protein